MGAKRKSRQKQNAYSNVVNLDNYQKKNQVTILPRNKNQETYVLKLLDSEKDIVRHRSSGNRQNSIGCASSCKTVQRRTS